MTISTYVFIYLRLISPLPFRIRGSKVFLLLVCGVLIDLDKSSFGFYEFSYYACSNDLFIWKYIAALVSCMQLNNVEAMHLCVSLSFFYNVFFLILMMILIAVLICVILLKFLFFVLFVFVDPVDINEHRRRSKMVGQQIQRYLVLSLWQLFHNMTHHIISQQK